MYNILFDEEQELLNTIRPWIATYKYNREKYVPEFKGDTPENIKEKYQEYLRFLEITKWRREWYE